MRSFICNVELIQIWFDLGLVMDEITKPLLKNRGLMKYFSKSIFLIFHSYSDDI